METSSPLSIESFSFKWVVNLKLSFDGLDDSFRASLEASDEAAFIEMDPKMAITSKTSLGDTQDFNFSSSQFPPLLVHADEVFSNGLLVPYFLTPSKEHTSDSIPTLPTSLESCRLLLPKNRIHRSFIRNCWSSCRRILKKHLCFSKKPSKRVRDSSSTTITQTIDARTEFDASKGTSPRTSTDYLIRDWSHDIEMSIQEAVLHCKRSFGRSLMFLMSVLIS
ncbi:hypothetical protein IFM89_021614 [Coptis chinensis]|uniref:Membrane-associated kinase regulator 6 n=1 Tax=Coptis chinensis TaxID=261450 RepID=A0A835IFZ5_9MAGN|nr:hypothetical protein IFM89_021614 [Coptis chinensis]